MNSYDTASDRLAGRESRKIANNTYLKARADGAIAVMLHETDVVTYFDDGRVVLNSGGWLTTTTKARMNEFSPIGVWTDRGVWYVSRGGTEDRWPYADGITYDSKERTFTGLGPDPKVVLKLRKRVQKYAKDFVKELAEGKINEPSLGDCLFCSHDMGTQADHVMSHMDESYFVPWLLVRALKDFGASQAAQGAAYEAMHGEPPWEGWMQMELTHDQIRKCIVRHCYRQLGLAT